MSSHSLKYGHIIRIRPNDSKTHSYITSKSYTDPKLYFQTYGVTENYENANQNENQQENDNEGEIIDVSNYRESLFEILPTSSFEINDEMNSIKDPVKKAQSLPRAKTQQQQFKTIIEEKRGKQIFFGDKVVFKHLDSKHYIYGSFDCAQSGIGAFKIDLREQFSEKLIFQLMSYRTYEKSGDEISIDAPLKLYHCETQCFLSYCMEPIFLDIYPDLGRQLDLSLEERKRHAISELKMRFFYSKKEENNNLVPNSFSGEQGMEEVSQSREKQPIMEIQSRYEIINENIAKRIWKFQPYLEFQQRPNKQLIRNHDIVYLLHTKDDKYLWPNNFQSSIFLNKRKDATDPSFIFDGLWEIEERAEQKMDGQSPSKARSPNPKKATNKNFLTTAYGGPTLNNSMMNVSMRKTGMITAGKKDADKKQSKGKKTYSLRHLMSGRVIYCSSDENRSYYEIKLKYVTEESDYQKKTPAYEGCILLECLDSVLMDGTLTRLSIEGGKSYLEVKSSQEETKALLEGGNVQQSQIQQGFSPFDEGQGQIQQSYASNFDTQFLAPVKDASEHGFRIYKVEQSIKEIALKIMSSQELLLKFLKFLSIYQPHSEKDNKILNMTLLNNVINVIKDLIGFIYNCDYNKIVSSGNSPITLRQRAFDELGMVQLITQLVEEINIITIKRKSTENSPNFSSLPDKSSQFKKIKTIYVLGYEVLESMAAYNPMLKIKISKYMNIYLDHILEPENRIVYKSIQQILDGNQLALEKKVQPIKIQDIIKTFGTNDTPIDPADLQFLSRLCLCRDRTVKKNQDSIFMNFYQKDTNKEKKFSFKEDHGKFQIASKISKKQDIRLRTLPQLYLQCRMSQMDGVLDPSKGHWNYFMQYLNLLADVCVDRNQTPLNYVLQNLPLKTLEQFLQQKIVRRRLLHQPFIRLVHYAFIEKQAYKEISRITKVKNWNELTDEKKIPHSETVVTKQIRKIMALITEYIKKINKKPWDYSGDKKKKMDIQDQDEEEPESIEFDPEDMSILKNVNTFLKILKSTLTLGFEEKMDNLKKIVPYMLKILQFDIHYAERVIQNPNVRKQIVHISEEDYYNKVYRKVKQELRLNKPNIVLLVQCKILAAQILDIIIDYQFSLRVSSITNYFKKVQQQEVDLRNYPYDEDKFKETWQNDIEYSLFAPSNEKEGFLMNATLWKDEIKKTIKEGDIFEYCPQHNVNHFLALNEAFIYGNQELTDLVLKILLRVTNERRGLLSTFEDIILVAGGNLKKLTSRVSVTRNALLKLTSQQVVEQTLAKNNLWRKYRPGGPSTQTNALGTIQQLAFLTIAMKQNETQNEARASKFYELTDLHPFFDFQTGQQMLDKYRDRSFLIITEKDENNPLNQNLIKSQDHHLLILNFIKIMNKKVEFPMLALHASYNFLTTLVWNNIDNKNYLEHFLPVAEQHLSINVGCIDFFYEMYKNNKKLVIKNDVTKIVNKVIEYANELDLDLFYHKSKLLDFLRVIIIFDNKGVAKNQNIVMEIISQYQVSDNNQIVYLKVEDKISQNIASNYIQWVQEYEVQYMKSLKTYEDLNVKPQLFYVATFFQIFSGLIEDENKVNIGKCTNMHPHSFLVKILKGYKNCWPVVRHLRSYINKLYYFTSREKETQIYTEFTNNDLSTIHYEIKQILILMTNAPDYNTIKFCNPIRYTYLGSYVYQSLEQCLHSLDLMFEDREYVRFLVLYLSQGDTEQTYYQLIFIMEMLEYLMKTIDGRSINKYLEKVSKHIKGIISDAPLKTVERYIEHEKNLQKQNMAKHKFSSEDTLFRKNYIFHKNKGFWRHLIDWNSHYEQEQNRQKAINAFAKKTDKEVEGDEKKKRDYLIDKLSLANIQKLILIQDPKRRADLEKGKFEIKDEGADEFDNNKEGEEVVEMAEDALPKNLVTSQSQRFKVKNERFDSEDDKNIVINFRRRKLVKFIEVNPEFKQFANQQTKCMLFQGFANLNDLSAKQYNNFVVVGKDDVIKTFVEMNRKDPRCINIYYKVQIVKMLAAFVQKESDIFQKSIQEWVVQKDEKQKINNAQNFLNQCDCAELLCSLFQNDINESIQFGNQIILFGICLVIGKNSEVQQKVLSILKNDEKNVILMQLEQLIKKNSESIANFTPYVPESQFNDPQYTDTYDFYNDNEKIMERRFMYIPQTVLEQKQFTEKMTFLQRIFIFLKVLCEGSNQEIKNYIREQVTNDEEKRVKTESINFIGLSSSQLKRLLADFRIKIMKVPLAIVDFINQVTSIPCVKNQLFLCKDTSYFHDFAQLQKTVKAQVKESKFDQSQINLLKDFFARNIRNCISCLQGNHEQIRKSLIVDDLPTYYIEVFSFFIDELKNEGWKCESPEGLEKEMKNRPRYEGKILDLFDVAKVVIKLQSWAPTPSFKGKIKFELQSNNMSDYYSLFTQNMLGIEINMDKGEADSDTRQIEYFPKHSVYGYLSRSTRALINEQVNRSTQKDKITGLINFEKVIEEEIDYSFVLDHEYKFMNVPVSIAPSKIKIFQNLALIIALLICMFMFLTVTVVYYPLDHAIEYQMGKYTFYMRMLSIIQFSVAMLYTLLWMLNHIKLAVGKYQLQLDAQEDSNQSKILQFIFTIPGLKKVYCLANYDQQFWGIVLFVLGSVLGTFYSIEWFSILIMNIMMQHMDVLKSMVASVTTKIKMLGMLSLLGTSFIAIFSIFSINYYVQGLYEEELPKQHCDTVMNCILELYIKEQINSEMESFQSGRFFFDMLYVIFMDLLFGNIVGGVLIDTFTELQEKTQAIDDDKTGKCFICGITKEVLEKKNEDIKTHYKSQFHKMWDYVFYIYNLNLKSEKVGLEFIIDSKIASEDVTWIPVQGADQEDVGERIQALEEAIKGQKKFINEIESAEK